jgi:hypothetical protein
MPIQKKTIKVLMFLLPAIVTLLGYTAFHEMLFREPPCLVNCNQPSLFSDNEKFKKWLAFLESLRDEAFNSKPNAKRTFPTPLDIAFLQDKINTASNDNDYLARYNQIISDLSSASNINQAGVDASRDSGLTDKVTPLVYLAEDNNPNSQVFASEPEGEAGNNPSGLNGPRNGPVYLAPSANGVPLFAGNAGSGDDGENNSGNGTGGGNGIPSDNSNPISTVPAPKSIYLILCGMLMVGLIKLKFLHRAHVLKS